MADSRKQTSRLYGTINQADFMKELYDLVDGIVSNNRALALTALDNIKMMGLEYRLKKVKFRDDNSEEMISPLEFAKKALKEETKAQKRYKKKSIRFDVLTEIYERLKLINSTSKKVIYETETKKEIDEPKYGSWDLLNAVGRAQKSLKTDQKKNDINGESWSDWSDEVRARNQEKTSKKSLSDDSFDWAGRESDLKKPRR